MICTSDHFLISILYLITEDVIAMGNWAKATYKGTSRTFFYNFLRVHDYFKIKLKKITFSWSTICLQMSPTFFSPKKKKNSLHFPLMPLFHSFYYSHSHLTSCQFILIIFLGVSGNALVSSQFFKGISYVVNIHQTLS